MSINDNGLSRYLTFTREEWAQLRDATPLTLSEEQLTQIQGINERLSLDEVTQIYLPLSRLLNLYVTATQRLHEITATFLGHQTARVPYVIGIAGSVAVGKSTTARLLQALLASWSSHPRVELITTDGFLYPNRILEARGLMKRKGFPESYDLRRLIQFMSDIKSGKPVIKAPVYSHLIYDILPDQMQIIEQPDIMIVEGLNVLQTRTASRSGKQPKLCVSDFFDFSIYVDAEESDLEQWYLERFLILRQTAFRNPSSYFRRYAQITEEESLKIAREIWEQINGLNLRENILATRERANLVLKKGKDHVIQEIKLCKI